MTEFSKTNFIILVMELLNELLGNKGKICQSYAKE